MVLLKVVLLNWWRSNVADSLLERGDKVVIVDEMND
eukprot:gene30005-39189_t